jgi:hypothetical protein
MCNPQRNPKVKTDKTMKFKENNKLSKEVT